ncbi:MAG: putative selenate ABC transporter substrate-binding protein [Pseudomonadales bacterium]|nr:putative selenate ABC transporter substrate-binding protein [Pseudomonadales bacterium]
MKTILLKKERLSCCLLLCVLFIAPLSVSAQTFTFTAIPDQDETQLQQRFNKIARYLKTQLGVEVRYIPVKSYSAAVTAFRNNQVQLAWFGGLSGVQARRFVSNSDAIAQGYEDQFFKTFFIANHHTGLTNSKLLPASLSKFTFTFGSKGSTSGRLMPEFYLREHYGVAPNKIFKRVGFSGDHSRTIALVQSGAYDLGAVNYKVWEKEVAAGKVDPEKVAVIWQTPTYPDYQWTLRGDVDKNWGKGFSEKIRTALITMDDPELLSSFPRSRFIPAKSSDYQAILDVAKSIGLID